MDDMRDLEEDYVRRLREAQERGDTKRVPLIDDHRMRKGKFLAIKEVIRDARRLLNGHLGGVER
jgi:hypothetical protein